MTRPHDQLTALVQAVLGERAGDALAKLDIDPALAPPAGETVSRAAFAMAMNVALFDDLLSRVPTGAAYVADRLATGGKVVFDHGALRTVLFADGPTGALPAGHLAFDRILAPLGYEIAADYPLPRLKMTGRAYRHIDAPETIPQFFVSELHVDQFDDAFQAAARNVFGASKDPLDQTARDVLAAFKRDGAAPFDLAARALPTIVAAFDRQHPTPAAADYDALLAQSAEAAWLATEGNAFNHATDRVADVEAVAEQQKLIGRPMKPKIEVAYDGQVRQTALRADMVDRLFVEADGSVVTRRVPGSFYEFISRQTDPATGRLDLRFDTGNAQGIFAMTRA